MDDKTEVIRQNIHETRESLVDKLETLEHQVVDTVQGTTNVVSNVKDAVQETVEQVKDTVQSTVETVKETVQDTLETVKDTVQGTVEAVKESVASTVEAVKHTFDVREHVQNYPWLMFGGSVVTGFVIGSTLPSLMRGGASSMSSFVNYMSPPRKNGANRGNGAVKAPAASAEATTARFSEPAPAEAKPSAFASLLGGEMSKLKGLALGTVATILREILEDKMPGDLGKQLAQMVSDVNGKLGGETIQGPILKRAHEGNGHAAASSEGRGWD
jgi:gas vesicle protein